MKTSRPQKYHPKQAPKYGFSRCRRTAEIMMPKNQEMTHESEIPAKSYLTQWSHQNKDYNTK